MNYSLALYALVFVAGGKVSRYPTGPTVIQNPQVSSTQTKDSFAKDLPPDYKERDRERNRKLQAVNKVFQQARDRFRDGDLDGATRTAYQALGLDHPNDSINSDISALLGAIALEKGHYKQALPLLMDT